MNLEDKIQLNINLSKFDRLVRDKNNFKKQKIMKPDFNIDTKPLEQALINSTESFLKLKTALNKIDNRSEIEKLIDWISYKLFGNKSCMPNELKSFR